MSMGLQTGQAQVDMLWSMRYTSNQLFLVLWFANSWQIEVITCVSLLQDAGRVPDRSLSYRLNSSNCKATVIIGAPYFSSKQSYADTQCITMQNNAYMGTQANIHIADHSYHGKIASGCMQSPREVIQRQAQSTNLQSNICWPRKQHARKVVTQAVQQERMRSLQEPMAHLSSDKHVSHKANWPEKHCSNCLAMCQKTGFHSGLFWLPVTPVMSLRNANRRTSPSTSIPWFLAKATWQRSYLREIAPSAWQCAS